DHRHLPGHRSGRHQGTGCSAPDGRVPLPPDPRRSQHGHLTPPAHRPEVLNPAGTHAAMVHRRARRRSRVSGGVLVDVPALDQLINTLSEAAERMHAANDRLRAASAADLGGSDLDHAAGDFQQRWEYGIGKIGEASEKMTDSLREAKKLYEQTDQ